MYIGQPRSRYKKARVICYPIQTNFIVVIVYYSAINIYTVYEICLFIIRGPKILLQIEIKGGQVTVKGWSNKNIIHNSFGSLICLYH